MEEPRSGMKVLQSVLMLSRDRRCVLQEENRVEEVRRDRFRYCMIRAEESGSLEFEPWCNRGYVIEIQELNYTLEIVREK
jgi:hypothetical protein